MRRALRSISSETGLPSRTRFEQLVAGVRGGFEQMLAPHLGFGLVLRGDVHPRVAHVRRVGLVLVPELHADQVDDALELLALAGGNGADGRHDVELLLHLLDAVEEIGPHAVELVDEGDARHAMLVGLVPDGFALHLDAADGAEDADGAVEDAQAALDLGREIDVAGSVDQRDARIAPLDA